jgi:hypothetical protein
MELRLVFPLLSLSQTFEHTTSFGLADYLQEYNSECKSFNLNVVKNPLLTASVV